jgi:hypothetical protein
LPWCSWRRTSPPSTRRGYRGRCRKPSSC